MEARVGVGELVELPDGVSVEVMASAGLGEVQVLGQQGVAGSSRVDAVGLGGGDRRLQVDARPARPGPGGTMSPRVDRLSLVVGVVFVLAGVVFPRGRALRVELRVDYLVLLGLIVVGLVAGQRLAAADPPVLTAWPATRPAAISSASPALASSRARLATRRPPVRRCSQSSSNGVRALPNTAASWAAAAPFGGQLGQLLGVHGGGLRRVLAQDQAPGCRAPGGLDQLHHLVHVVGHLLQREPAGGQEPGKPSVR